MIMKKKITLQYPLHSSSIHILWNAISTPSGLQRWFADEVTKENKSYIFKWGKTERREAEIINSRSESFVRFHWNDEQESRTFFELKIHYSELTNDYLLEITDFAEQSEEEDTKNLWDSQIEVFRRVFGV